MNTEKKIGRIDLHMHTSVSDGTDSPKEIIGKVRAAGIDLFSVTDHDAVKGCDTIRALLKADDPLFISGIEFSCKDEYGKYHILGYGYDAEAEAIRSIVQYGHNIRIEKLGMRLEALRDKYGFTFSDSDIAKLYSLDNPGKPHLANLMVRYGYAKDKSEAFGEYLNRIKLPNANVRPEMAIEGILKSGGIPVLAHPSYGSGDELYTGDEMEERLKRLIGFGLRGVEAFYSGFSDKLTNEMLEFAEKYDLYVTAGSDYHGSNKLIEIGDVRLDDVSSAPEALHRFLADVPKR